MESLIKQLQTKATNFNSISGCSGGKPLGLDKLANAEGLTQFQFNFLLAFYLNDKNSLIRMKSRLISMIDIEENKKEYIIKVVFGVIKAYSTNAFRIVDCYKCKTKGCERCGNTGKTAKKPKAYELCGINRNTWNNPRFSVIRNEFDRLYSYLNCVESDIRVKYNKNKQLNKQFDE